MISRRHMMVASTALALQQPVLGSTLPTWQRLPTEPYRGKQDDIAFVSPDSGWYGNGDGKLYAPSMADSAGRRCGSSAAPSSGRWALWTPSTATWATWVPSTTLG